MSRRFRQGGREIPEGFPIHPDRAVLAGLDGLDPADEEAPSPKQGGTQLPPLRLTREARARVRAEIERAGGREVCFLAEVDARRRVHDPRAVSRGNYDAVLVAAVADTVAALLPGTVVTRIEEEP